MSSTTAPAGASVNRQWRLAARPKGLPTLSDWEYRTEPVPEPAEGQFLVRVLYISLDPAMRGWMNDGRSYVPPVGLGEVMRAGGMGRVVASRHPDFKAGDHVVGMFGVQDYAISDGRGVIRVGRRVGSAGSLSQRTRHAWDDRVLRAARDRPPGCGRDRGRLVRGGRRRPGRRPDRPDQGLSGRRVAGGPEKCRLIVDELGFDAAIDYKNEDVHAGLREHYPDRVNVYFDNVGGEILDTVLTRLARHARIVLCGSISQYNNEGPARGPSNYMALLVERARMGRFLVFDYAQRYAEAARRWPAG